MAARSNREEKSDYHGGAGDLPGRVERKAHGGIETSWYSRMKVEIHNQEDL
jgi:hypothetical protein